jgi:hypothetical protein
MEGAPQHCSVKHYRRSLPSPMWLEVEKGSSLFHYFPVEASIVYQSTSACDFVPTRLQGFRNRPLS